METSRPNETLVRIADDPLIFIGFREAVYGVAAKEGPNIIQLGVYLNH